MRDSKVGTPSDAASACATLPTVPTLDHLRFSQDVTAGSQASSVLVRLQAEAPGNAMLNKHRMIALPWTCQASSK